MSAQVLPQNSDRVPTVENGVGVPTQINIGGTVVSVDLTAIKPTADMKREFKSVQGDHDVQLQCADGLAVVFRGSYARCVAVREHLVEVCQWSPDLLEIVPFVSW